MSRFAPFISRFEAGKGSKRCRRVSGIFAAERKSNMWTERSDPQSAGRRPSGRAAPIHGRQRGRSNRTESRIATDRHPSARLRTIEPARSHQIVPLGTGRIGIIRALQERQPVAFAVAIYRNGRACDQLRRTRLSERRAKTGQGCEEESKRHKRAQRQCEGNTTEPGHRSFSEALERSSRRSPVRTCRRPPS